MRDPKPVLSERTTRIMIILNQQLSNETDATKNDDELTSGVSSKIMESVDENGETQQRDKLTETIGEFGRWQLFLFIILSFPVKMSASWTQMGIVYFAAKTTFRCKERMNSSSVIVNSTCYSDCVKYEYETDFENTVISQWGLICGKAWLANFIQTVCMFDILVGSIIFGFVADRYGRRPAFLSACLLQLIASLIEPFSPNYWTFTVIRFFLGIATAGIMVVSFVILMEVIGPSRREIMNSVYHIPLPLGIMVMPIFAYYLRSWNKFTFGVAMPNFLFLTYFFLVPESPKWLLSMGRIEEASVVMETIAKWNQLPTENMLEKAKEIIIQSKLNERVKGETVKATYLDLITKRSLRIKNLLSCVTWFILGICFFGGTQYIGQTSTNVFLTMFMSGALQGPGILLAGYTCRKIGRRATIITLFIVCSISNGFLAFSDDWYYIKLAAGSVATACGSAAFATIYMYTSELFPTVARNMAIGASSTISRIGSMLAPFIAGLAVQGAWIPPTIFGIVPLIAAGASACLPETRGQKLTDYIVDN